MSSKASINKGFAGSVGIPAELLGVLDRCFMSETACADWFLARYYPAGLRCPDCGCAVEGGAAERNFRALRRFECSGCGSRIKPTKHTALGCAKLNVQQFVLLALLIELTRDNNLIAEKVGVSACTVREWREKFQALAEAGH